MAFESNRSGNFDIWVMPTAGGEPRQVTVHPALDTEPQWSPDGKWLIFISDRIESPPASESNLVLSGGEVHLWRVPIPDGTPEQVSKTSGMTPRWSPDGKEIYFRRGALYGGELSALSLENGPSTDAGRIVERRLLDWTGRSGLIGPFGMATDSRHIYFMWLEQIGDIWVMDVVRED